MLSLVARRRIVAALRTAPSRHASNIAVLNALQRRTLVSAPKPGDGPLMERRADRELPDVAANSFRWSRTFPVFLAIIACCSVAIFNYQKMSSPVVASTLYALRTSPKAREYLGDEIYFNNQIPWIRGEMNQLHGRINIYFTVKGTRRSGVMRFASHRPSPRGLFETTEWSLETDDGRKIDLLEGADPFKGLSVSGDEIGDEALDAPATRGFRQMRK